MTLNLTDLKKYAENQLKERLDGMENYKYITNMTKKQTRKYNSFYQIITTVNTTPEQKYELLESFVDAIIKEDISQEREKMAEQVKSYLYGLDSVPWEEQVDEFIKNLLQNK